MYRVRLVATVVLASGVQVVARAEFAKGKKLTQEQIVIHVITLKRRRANQAVSRPADNVMQLQKKEPDVVELLDQMAFAGNMEGSNCSAFKPLK